MSPLEGNGSLSLRRDKVHDQATEEDDDKSGDGVCEPILSRLKLSFVQADGGEGNKKKGKRKSCCCRGCQISLHILLYVQTVIDGNTERAPRWRGI